MHSYPLNLAPGAARDFTAQADLFVYESGAVTPDTGDLRIIVKPDTGGEIVLRPGQRFRLAPGAKATNWNVKANDAAMTITGSLVIGAGEFDDANTLNTFKLDGTFTNTVKVSNTTAERVPVELDAAAGIKINNTTAQRVPVSLDSQQSINVSGALVTYTHKYVGNTASLAQTAIAMLAAASNINGAVLEKFDVNIGTGTLFTIVAKATPPASTSDGDVLFMSSGPVGVNSLDMAKSGRIKVPAGMGIWYVSQAADNSNLRAALFTVL